MAHFIAFRWEQKILVLTSEEIAVHNKHWGGSTQPVIWKDTSFRLSFFHMLHLPIWMGKKQEFASAVGQELAPGIHICAVPSSRRGTQARRRSSPLTLANQVHLLPDLKSFGEHGDVQNSALNGSSPKWNKFFCFYFCTFFFFLSPIVFKSIKPSQLPQFGCKNRKILSSVKRN